METLLDTSSYAWPRRMRRDESGAVLIEAAIALPIIIMLLLGIVSYAGWFMAAHSLQQAANEAARASLAGLDSGERRELVGQAIAKSVLNAGTLQPDLVTVSTAQDANYFTVSLSYDVAASRLFKASVVPLPGPTIDRDAVIQLSSL